MKEVIILFLSISIFTSIDMVAQSKKELRKKKRKETYLETIKALESDKYIFGENWASSRSGRRVPIAVDRYTMSMNGTKTSADLPFNE